jgi:hypothetical protein
LEEEEEKEVEEIWKENADNMDENDFFELNNSKLKSTK